MNDKTRVALAALGFTPAPESDRRPPCRASTGAHAATNRRRPRTKPRFFGSSGPRRTRHRTGFGRTGSPAVPRAGWSGRGRHVLRAWLRPTAWRAISLRPGSTEGGRPWPSRILALEVGRRSPPSASSSSSPSRRGRRGLQRLGLAHHRRRRGVHHPSSLPPEGKPLVLTLGVNPFAGGLDAGGTCRRGVCDSPDPVGSCGAW